MEPGGSLPHSQELATCPYPEQTRPITLNIFNALVSITKMEYIF
jgi:hypothetical protein